jgi:hypothetical protein
MWSVWYDFVKPLSWMRPLPCSRSGLRGVNLEEIDMTRSCTIIGAAIAAGGAGTLGASAVHAQTIIDFNGLPGIHDLLVEPYMEDGYTLTSIAAGQAAEINGFQPNGLFLAGTNAMPQIVRLMNGDNDPFDLLSIAIGDNSLGQSITFTGSNGASYLVQDGNIGLGVNFAALGGWQNLAWVDITVHNAPSGAPGQMTADNITVLTIPGPSALATIAMMSALAGRGRRRTSINRSASAQTSWQ